MPTFYWVGGTCPKDNTPASGTGSHMWGIAEYNWNNPNNWIVAHSVHHVRLPGDWVNRDGDFGGGISGASGGSAQNYFFSDTIDTYVEVYGTPNRCPGPGDTAFVGHFPWLMHEAKMQPGNSSTSTVPPLFADSRLGNSNSSSRHRNGIFVVTPNNMMFDNMAWMMDYGSGGPSGQQFTARGLGRSSALPVLVHPSRKIQVPRGVVGTSNTPVYEGFYATTSTNVPWTPDIDMTQWGTFLPLTGAPDYIYRETNDFNRLAKYMLARKNDYRNYKLGRYADFSSTNMSNVYGTSFISLPEKCVTPLLWGGCYSSTGSTSSLSVEGGTGNTYWPNAGASGVDVIAVTGQALKELNVIMYGPMYTWGSLRPNGYDSEGTKYQSVYANGYDIYPFSSVGDGIYGTLSDIVKYNFTNNYQLSTSGGTSDYGCTQWWAAGGQVISRNYDNYLARGITAEGERVNSVFVKVKDATITMPNEWNKYAGQNPYGFMFLNSPVGERRTVYSRTRETTYLPNGIPQNEAWGTSWLNQPNPNDQFDYSSDDYVSLRNKYVHLRFADYCLQVGATGLSAPEWNYITSVYCHMPYGQFDMPYGKLNKVKVGLNRAYSYDDYLDIPGENVSAGAMVAVNDSPGMQKTSSYTRLKTGMGTLDGAGDVGNRNLAWPTFGRCFFGANANEDISESRINFVTTWGSATFNEKCKVGSLVCNMAKGDLIENLGSSLTAPTTNQSSSYYNIGHTEVIHGLKYPRPNSNGDVSAAYVHGSTLTGSNYYRPLIKTKNNAKTSTNNQIPEKTGLVVQALNSEIGDIILTNTDYYLLPDSAFGLTGPGQKSIDRIFARESANIDISSDMGGYIHIGRILNAGSTGGTGSVYGGLIFESDSNCTLRPSAGHRFWVSTLQGFDTDKRQPELLPTYVASNLPPEGETELPFELDNSGDVLSTSTQNPSSPSSGFVSTVSGRDGRLRDHEVIDAGDVFGELPPINL